MARFIIHLVPTFHFLEYHSHSGCYGSGRSVVNRILLTLVAMQWQDDYVNPRYDHIAAEKLHLRPRIQYRRVENCLAKKLNSRLSIREI